MGYGYSVNSWRPLLCPLPIVYRNPSKQKKLKSQRKSCVPWYPPRDARELKEHPREKSKRSVLKQKYAGAVPERMEIAIAIHPSLAQGLWQEDWATEVESGGVGWRAGKSVALASALVGDELVKRPCKSGVV